MAPRQTLILQPKYASEFLCIGPECEDSCCVGWNVFFDQKSCANYEALPDSPLKLKILNNLKPIPDELSSASKPNARMLQMTAEDECPLLRTDRLCGIQTTLGADALSSICANFPRIQYTIDKLDGAVLTLACPEAARLVIENKSLLNNNAEGHYQFNWDDEKTAGESLQGFFWPIREFSIRLVTNRNYPLWQRLFLLGLFARRLDQFADNVKSSSGLNFGRMFNEFDKAVHSGHLRSEMVKIPANLGLQLQLMSQFITLRMNSHACPERMLDLIRKFKTGVNRGGSNSVEAQIRTYSDACINYYEPLMHRNPYLLENYIVNQIFRTLFPFGQDGLLTDNQNSSTDASHPNSIALPSRSYLQLATQFALVKGILIGLAGYYRAEFTPRHAVDAIQIITRNFEHHQIFLDQSYAKLQSAGHDTPAGFATLLRN